MSIDENEIQVKDSETYYLNHYQIYFEKTVNVDPAPFLRPFVRNLSSGRRVWDIGCGSGRDLLWLKERGLDPTGLERSMGLARLARNHSRCPVVVGDFETFDFSRIEADGMLLTAALVHVLPNRLEVVLRSILGGLKIGGTFFISMKQGTGISQDHAGRQFYLWHSHDLESIFEKLNLSVLEMSSNTSALVTGETWLGYLCRKKGMGSTDA